MRSTLRPLSTLLFCALALSLLTRPATAQCTGWRVGGAQTANGVNDYAYAATTWVPAAGQPAHLVVGGGFLRAGSVAASGIADYHNGDWHAMGHLGLLSLPTYPGFVEGLTTWDPDGSGSQPPVVVAVGDFDNASGSPLRGVGYWDGALWHQFTSEDFDFYPQVVTTWDADGSGPANAQLIIAGEFATIGTGTYNGIARWNGASWSPVGGGVQLFGSSGFIHSMTVYDPDGPSGPILPLLIVGGEFDHAGGVPCNNIAAWDGSAWHALGSGITGSPSPTGGDPNVRGLTTWDPDGNGPLLPRLVATGAFINAGGVAASCIATWNGSSWQALDSGLTLAYDPNQNGPGAAAVMSWDPDGTGPLPPVLIAAGGFDHAGGVGVEDVAYWDGSAWHSMGQSVSYYGQALTTWDPDGTGAAIEQPILVGNFTYSGENFLRGVGRWDGTMWRPVAVPASHVYAATPYSGVMVYGGSFTAIDNSSYGQTTTNLVAWDGLVTLPLAVDNEINGTVRALKSFTLLQSQILIAAGDFTTANGITANRIAQYAQGNSALSGWSAFGAGFNNTVYAVERFSNATFAAGSFTASGGTGLASIARWDGTAWQPLGTGLNGTCYALKTYNGFLYAGGSFTTAGGLASGGLARWNGTAWSIVGGNFIGTVRALEVFNNELVIGGTFAGISGSPNIAKYNGTTYTNLASGGTNGVVNALAVDGANLFVGGDFTAAGGISALRLARWNGASWSDVAGGADGAVNAMSAQHGELNIGGDFFNVSGGALVAQGWARYLETGVPWVAEQPSPINAVCAGQHVYFYVAPANGYYNVTLTWRHNGVPLAAGPQQGGSTVSFTYYNYLDINNVTGTDSGTYDCVISSVCGTATSFAVRLAVNSADFNGDGDIGTDADIESFFACLGGSCCSTCGSADFNGDGDIGTDADIESFFRVLGGGACG